MAQDRTLGAKLRTGAGPAWNHSKVATNTEITEVSSQPRDFK